ncbi:MAG: sugar-binding protein [Capsulimonadaceae bacterium]|nr:sugar-binding protein [Capsulimonadaceae bacterium]
MIQTNSLTLKSACAAALLLGILPVVYASTLSADTSRPEHSTYALGETVKIVFNATGLPPASDTTLRIAVKDEYEAIRSQTVLAVHADASGNWSGEYSATPNRLGFYRVCAALADGATLPALGNRPAGCLTYAIVPDPAKRNDYGENASMFGMQGGFSSKAPVIPYLGVRWVLAGYEWGRNEKDHAGQFAEDRAKAGLQGKIYPPLSPEVDEVRYNGKPWQTYDLPCLNGTPTWAAIPGTIGTDQGALSEAGKTAWRDYCTEIGKAFSQNFPKRQKHYYQITWEPCAPWGFKGTNDQLVEIYRIAYPALHAADPKAFVLGPTGDGISRDAVRWNEDIFKAGLAKYVDGVTIHPYCQNPPEKTGLVQYYRALKDVIRQYAGKDLPLYGTEQGFALRDQSGSEIELSQARYDIRDSLITAGEGFGFNFAFYVAGAGYDYYYGCNPRIRCGSDKLAPRPVVPAYSAMTYLIDGHPTAGAIEWLGGDTTGYVFQRGDDVILVLWDAGDKPRKLSLPVGVKQVALYDWMGNPSTANSPDGNVEVTLSQEPIYIKGVSPALWGRTAAHPIAAQADRLTAFPGEIVSVKASVTSASKLRTTGTVRLVADPRLNVTPIEKQVALDASKQTVQFALKTPRDCVAGTYPLKLTLSAGGSSIGAAGTQLVLQAPLSIDSVGPAFEHGEPALRVAISNATRATLTGTLNVRVTGVPGSRKTLTVPIAAAATSVVIAALPGVDVIQARKYNVEASVSIPGGSRSEKVVSFNFLAAPQFSSPPVIDGNLGKWDSVQGTSVSGRSAIVRSPQFYNGHLAASVKYAWDSKALYAAFDVTDPVFMQPYTGGDMWKGDCVQLGFNLDPDKADVSSGNDFADQQSRRYTQINVALTPNGPEADRAISYDPGKLPTGQLTPSQLQLAVVKSASGLRYEMAIPWSTLGAPSAPRAGDRIGVAATINDMNREKQPDPAALGFFCADWPHDPAAFGQIVLTGKP